MNGLLGASVEGFFYGRAPTSWPTLAEAVRDVVSLGLGVEWWAVRGEEDTEPAPTLIEEIHTLCTDAPFVSMHTRYDLWRWNPTGLRQEIALCASVGASTLVLHTGSLGLYDPSSRGDVPAIKRLAKEAQDIGVQLALENGRDSLWAFDWVLDALGSDPDKTNLGICIDIGHAHLSEDAGRQPIRAYLERYRESLTHLHLHDNLGKEDDHRLPGKGSIDWHAVFQTLEAIGYAGPAVLELHSDGDPFEAVQAAATFLNRLL